MLEKHAYSVDTEMKEGFLKNVFQFNFWHYFLHTIILIPSTMKKVSGKLFNMVFNL